MNEQASKAKILLVESLAPIDLVDDWSEVRATRDVLRTLGVGSYLFHARSKGELESACGVFKSGIFDVLHLAAHGCGSGVCMTDSGFVEWIDLARHLGRSIDGKTLVLSACEGGCDSVPRLFAGLQHQPSVIVGPSSVVPWPELVIGWQVYYRSVFPAMGMAEAPCLAISRVQLATGIKLSCHVWDHNERRYVFWESCSACAREVYMNTYPERRVAAADFEREYEALKVENTELANLLVEQKLPGN